MIFSQGYNFYRKSLKFSVTDSSAKHLFQIVIKIIVLDIVVYGSKTINKILNKILKKEPNNNY